MIDFFTHYASEIGAVFFALVTVFALWKSMIPDTAFSKRLNSLHKRKSDLVEENLSSARKGQRMVSSLGLVKRIVEKLKLMGSVQAKEAQMIMAQAGYRTREAMMLYLFIKSILPLVLGVPAALFAYGVMGEETKSIFKLLICVSAVFAGYYAPGIFVRNIKQRRKDAIRKALPDALDLMVICAQAGLSLDATLKRVSDEIDETYSELADELSLTGVELGFLQNRTEALNNLNRRVDLSQMRSLISTLAQTEKYGTPLSNSLRVLAQEYRDERMMKAEEKAARLPAILTLPMIIFILPPLFIVLLGPGIIQAIDSFASM